jgi:hypothetical protein
MTFDQSRQQRASRKVDDRRVRRGDAVERPHRVNAIAPDTCGPSLVKALAVEHARRPQDDHRPGRGVAAGSVLPRTAS